MSGSEEELELDQEENGGEISNNELEDDSENEENQEEEQIEDNNDDDNDEQVDDEVNDSDDAEVKKEKMKKKFEKFKEKEEKKGLIYLGRLDNTIFDFRFNEYRIPPYMKPMKLRNLLSQFGKIGRIYLAPESTNFPILSSDPNRPWDKKKAKESWRKLKKELYWRLGWIWRQKYCKVSYYLFEQYSNWRTEGRLL